MTYRALEQYRFAESFRAATRIVDLPEPQPGPGEVLVRNAWCGINGKGEMAECDAPRRCEGSGMPDFDFRQPHALTLQTSAE